MCQYITFPFEKLNTEKTSTLIDYAICRYYLAFRQNIAKN